MLRWNGLSFSEPKIFYIGYMIVVPPAAYHFALVANSDWLFLLCTTWRDFIMAIIFSAGTCY